MPTVFEPGITTLLRNHPQWLKGRKVGLVSHPAAVDRRGVSTLELLLKELGPRLVAVFGPEHGFFGGAGAGENVRTVRHPAWGIPVFSLYGKDRKPSARMLRGIDTIVFDLQDLAARPYTYVSTLRGVLEAASELDKEVIVADRPVPLPSVVDGPVVEPGFESFVSAVRTPVAYGMTPGEAALWISRDLKLPATPKISKMRGYKRDLRRSAEWPPWIPPSPGIRSWECAVCYTATVFLEAIPSVDHGRSGTLPFQLFGATWMRSRPICKFLSARRLPGAEFHPHPYLTQQASGQAVLLDGVRMVVVDPKVFKPVTTGVAILHALQSLYGIDAVWKKDGTRPEFFDKLFGTDAVRRALLDGASAEDIATSWQCDQFNRSRKAALLYRQS